MFRNPNLYNRITNEYTTTFYQIYKFDINVNLKLKRNRLKKSEHELQTANDTTRKGLETTAEENQQLRTGTSTWENGVSLGVTWG